MNTQDCFIKSILDNDKYKFTQQQAVLEHYPDAWVTYTFINRGNHKFMPEFYILLNEQLEKMKSLVLTDEEYAWLKETQVELKPMYLEYLRNYRFKTAEITISFVGHEDDEQFDLRIEGPWHSTILWEVPLMALISECYHKSSNVDFVEYQHKLEQKREIFDQNCCINAEFGTRRRYSFDIHELAVKTLSKGKCFVGTSNMYLAMRYNCTAIGTIAHEFFMGISALETLRYANRKTMKRWYQTYNGRLGIVLTDTYGVDDFLTHFDHFYARLFDGVRHDSGDPYKFTDKIVAHYKKLKIDPTSKVIVFSDGLNPETVVKIKKYCDGKIKCSFGIGTNLTCDTGDAMNMVIKLRNVNGIDVVKLSDTPTKATGEESAIAIAMNVFHGKKIALSE